MNDGALRRQAEAHGVQVSYAVAGGAIRHASTEALRAILAAIGVDPTRPSPPSADGRWPPVLVVRPGAPRRPPMHTGHVVREDGHETPLPALLPGPLPPGYHRIVGRRGSTTLVVAPDRCYLPEHLRAGGRDAGYAVQLYAMRSERSWGLGDLADLHAFATRPEPPAFVLLNPLHAALPLAGQDPSPYAPSTRRYRNPLYIAVDQVPERSGLTGDDAAAAERAAAAGRALNAQGRLDRAAVFALKDAALRRCFARIDAIPGRRAALAAYRADDPDVTRFATFCAICEELGDGWSSWPARLQQPDGPEVLRYAAEHAERVAYHVWLQLLLDEQLSRAATGRLGLITDLAVGVAADGYDVWSSPGLFATGMAVGAPPDPLALEGQDWGLPPLVPARLRAGGYRELAAVLRANMRHAGGIRIDHAMGFFRLFWIPEGMPAADGAYVRYPADDLLGVLALESDRARCLVVGEALGTVEPGVLRALESRDVLAYRVTRWEDRRPRQYPRRALATVTTHDMPTLAALVADENLPYLRSIGAVSEEGAARIAASEEHDRTAIRARLEAEGLWPRGEAWTVEETIVGLYDLLARTPCMLACVALDDALGAVERPNVPGTTDAHPNWRVPLPVALEEFGEVPLFRSIAALMRRRADEPDGGGAREDVAFPP